MEVDYLCGVIFFLIVDVVDGFLRDLRWDKEGGLMDDVVLYFFISKTIVRIVYF